jgi:hypothetical protein
MARKFLITYGFVRGVLRFVVEFGIPADVL